MRNFNDTQVIIMAGGVGSRFWPMSTPDYPKQFIDVMGVGRSLIQLTVDRLKPICPVENMWVVTNEKYISIVKEQIPDMPVENILSEPEARNTAPCIAYTLPAEFGWSDLGSWGSLRTLLPQDEAGNAKVGKDIRLYECKNCVVHTADESKVVVQGLDGYIVAEKNGQLLVCSLKEEQRIKEFGK